MQLFTQAQKAQTTIIPQNVPVYRVREGKFYADDRLFDEGKIIIWDEEPNKNLEPLNDMAIANYEAFLLKLDRAGHQAALAAGKGYASELDAFKNSMILAREEGKRVTVLNDGGRTPIMGGQKRGKPKATEIDIGAVHVEPEVVASDRVAVNKISEPELKDTQPQTLKLKDAGGKA